MTGIADTGLTAQGAHTNQVSTATALPPATPKKDPLGRDAFLNLLVTQLQHQDPTAPQADGEFIAQLAQFSSLEQLTQIQTTLTAIQAALGVTTTTTPTPTPTTGTSSGQTAR